MIFSTINGDSNVNFYNELAAQGITAEKIPVVAVSVGEDELRGLDPAKVKGHLAAWNYFQSIDTPKNKEFVKKFKDKYGKDRVTDDPIEAAYIGVYFWKLAVEKAKSTDVDKVREALQERHRVRRAGRQGQARPQDPAHLQVLPAWARSATTSSSTSSTRREPIEPDPYPQIAFPGWSCDWTKGGVTQGQGGRRSSTK